MGHASNRAALIYLRSSPDRQRAIADAIGAQAIKDLGWTQGGTCVVRGRYSGHSPSGS
jgi:hypothetical protein